MAVLMQYRGCRPLPAILDNGMYEITIGDIIPAAVLLRYVIPLANQSPHRLINA